MAKRILASKDLTLPMMRMNGIGGCHPVEENSIIKRLMFWSLLIIDGIFVLLSIAKCASQRDIVMFAKCYTDFIVFSQIFAKSIVYVLRRAELKDLLETFWNEFWPIDTVKSRTTENNQIYKITLMIARFYGFALNSSMVTLALISLMITPRTMPFLLYFFGYENTLLLQHPYYEIFWLFQFTIIITLFFVCLTPFETLFMLLCGCVFAQFNLLKLKLQEAFEDGTGESEAMEILKMSIKHHNMLMMFIKKMEVVFSGPLLKQYVDNMTIIGILLYLSQQTSSAFAYVGLLANSSQAFVFSIFGQLVEDSSFSIANAAYAVNWQNKYNFKLRLGLMLIIQRAQRQCNIAAGGLIKMSFESFLRIFKAASSFLAVLRSASKE